MNKISEELRILLPLVKKIGKEIMKIYDTDFSYDLKEDNSPITDADRLSNNMLLEGLKCFNYAFISEESIDSKERFEKEKIWIIAPLDGTKDFIQKTGDFSIMVGLIKNKEPILGVIYVPVSDKLYFAEKGKGSFLKIGNNSLIKLKVSLEENFENYKMVISRNHFKDEDKKIAINLGIKNFKKMGSIGIKFVNMAEGKSNFYLNTSPYLGEWDLCAPQLILQEAGGEVFDLNGDDLKFNTLDRKMKKGVIATTSKNKDKIILSIS